MSLPRAGLALALLLAWERPAAALDYGLLARDLEVMKSIVVASFRGTATPAAGQLGTLILRNTCQAIYLEGYGAVFTLELWYRDRPALRPTTTRSSEKSAGSDSEGSSSDAPAVTGAELFQELLRMARQRPEQQGLARKVALERFIDLLANHGASIRQLKPSESVTLIGVQTASAPDMPQRVQASARRADLAALQRGELSLEQFKSRVSVLEY